MYSLLLLLFALPPSDVGGSLLADPVTTRAKAVITDQFGNPVPLVRESAVGLMVFSAKKSVHGATPDSVKWTIRPIEYDSRKWVPSDNNLEVGIALEGQPVTLTVFLSVSNGTSVDHLVLDVKCGKGGQPPPDPPKPDPPKPDPAPVAKYVRLVVVEDQFNRTPETAAILNARAFWDGLKSQGHQFAVFAENDPTSLGRIQVQTVYEKRGLTKFPQGSAFLLIQDATNSFPVMDPIPLPSVDEMESLIKKYTGAN